MILLTIELTFFSWLQPLTGWELAYLKVCCKVQGVRKDLIAGSTLQIVKVSDLRSYFPRRTVFTEECWPEPKMKSLLPKSNAAAGAPANNQIPQCDKWTKVIPYVNSAAPPSNCPKGTTPASTIPVATSTLVSISNSVSQSQAMSVIAVRNNGTSAASNSNTSVAVRVANGAQNIPIPIRLQANSEALRKIKVLSPPQGQELSRLQVIPEFPDSNTENAYSVRLVRYQTIPLFFGITLIKI